MLKRSPCPGCSRKVGEALAQAERSALIGRPRGAEGAGPNAHLLPVLRDRVEEGKLKPHLSVVPHFD